MDLNQDIQNTDGSNANVHPIQIASKPNTIAVVVNGSQSAWSEYVPQMVNQQQSPTQNQLAGQEQPSQQPIQHIKLQRLVVNNQMQIIQRLPSPNSSTIQNNQPQFLQQQYQQPGNQFTQIVQNQIQRHPIIQLPNQPNMVATLVQPNGPNTQIKLVKTGVISPTNINNVQQPNINSGQSNSQPPNSGVVLPTSQPMEITTNQTQNTDQKSLVAKNEQNITTTDSNLTSQPNIQQNQTPSEIKSELNTTQNTVPADNTSKKPNFNEDTVDTKPGPSTAIQNPSNSKEPNPVEENLQILTNECIRFGCGNLAVKNPEWEGEYCSNECVVTHCRDVFQKWVSSKITTIELV